MLLDLAISLGLGGDCLADVAVLRAEPRVYGRVASDATVSRTIDALAKDAPAALAAINSVRAAARARVWQLAGKHGPDHGSDADHPLVVDVDATLVTSYSEKESARPTFKPGFGHHPVWAFADHGSAVTGEPLAVLPRPGSAGSKAATNHITVIREALRQLPGHRVGSRPGRKVLVRIDGARPTPCSTGSSADGCPTRSASGCPPTPRSSWPRTAPAGHARARDQPSPGRARSATAKISPDGPHARRADQTADASRPAPEIPRATPPVPGAVAIRRPRPPRPDPGPAR